MWPETAAGVPVLIAPNPLTRVRLAEHGCPPRRQPVATPPNPLIRVQLRVQHWHMEAFPGGLSYRKALLRIGGSILALLGRCEVDGRLAEGVFFGLGGGRAARSGFSLSARLEAALPSRASAPPGS